MNDDGARRDTEGLAMARARKTFFALWAAVTAIALLAAWIQTNRLSAVSQDRERIRLETLTTLLEQSQQVLDQAAGQAGARNLGNSAANLDASLSLLGSAAKVGDERASEDIRVIVQAVKKARGDIIQGDEQGKAEGDIKREAANVRALLNTL